MLNLPRTRLFWSVGLGHFINDTFMAMGVVLLTFLSVSLVPMSNTMIGFAVSAQQLTGALSQPFFGIRADRTGGRRLGSGGLGWVVGMFMLTIALAALTRNYWLMLIPFVLQGLGSGALHPVGSLHAANADRARSASNMAYFFLMGQLGLALGPTLIGVLLDTANPAAAALEQTQALIRLPVYAPIPLNVVPVYTLMLFAIPAVFFMVNTIPASRIYGQSRSSDGESLWAILKKAPRMPFIVLAVMVTLRGLAQPGSVNFIPALFQSKGWTPAEYGLITTSFWIAAGFSGVFFGSLADRYDRRWVMMLGMLASAPAFFLLPIVDGAPAFLAAVIAGGLSGGSHSLIVVLAQEMVPARKGFASGAILGFIFGTGALGSLIIGSISDQIGLGTTFQIVAAVAVISGLMALLLPKHQAQ